MSKFDQIREIQTQIKDAEALVDQALTAQSELIAKLLKTRMELGLPAHFGNEALAKCVDVAGHMSKGRTYLVSAHDSLAQDVKNIRHFVKPGQIVSFDFYSECPKHFASSSEEPAKMGEVVPLRASESN